MKSNSKTSIILLICAILAGAGGWYISQQHISSEINSYKANFDAERESIDIVVADMDLAVGDTVSAQNAAVRKIPRVYVPRDAVTPDQFAAIEGRQVINPIGKGEPILLLHLVEKKIEGIASLLKPGERAITIPVSTLDTFSGFLSPGDYIDLMITLKDGEDKRTVPLAQNLRVLATGSDLDDGVPQQQQMRFTEITLGVTPLVATRLIHAQTVGDLSLLLRRPEDQGDQFEDYVTVDNLVDIPIESKPAPPPPKNENGWEFELIKGGKRS